MEFSDDRKEVEEWIPLVMEGRADDDAVAVTRMITGSDVDYGSLTRQLIEYVSELGGCTVHYSTPVTDIHRTNCGTWRLTVLDDAKHKHRDVETDFVFLGAGGGALPLLQKSGIPEGKGYGGFPVSGIWLRCDNEELADRHDAKVYGKAASGSPPMSVPHLDKRVIDGKRALLFGPYAGTSPKFLKHGSHLALFKSVKWDNIVPMMAAGADNVSLVKYLAGQVVQSEGHRFDVLRGYFPEADPNDWILQVAGQRVQIIEHGQAGEKRGLLKFGTELVKSDDGSLVTLLGASPGASTAVWVILEVIKHCFPARVQGAWGRRLAELVPSFGKSLIDDTDLCQRVRAETSETLQLKNID
jgi:malate dehydrogenase (quinone)